MAVKRAVKKKVNTPKKVNLKDAVSEKKKDENVVTGKKKIRNIFVVGTIILAIATIFFFRHRRYKENET